MRRRRRRIMRATGFGPGAAGGTGGTGGGGAGTGCAGIDRTGAGASGGAVRRPACAAPGGGPGNRARISSPTGCAVSRGARVGRAGSPRPDHRSRPRRAGRWRAGHSWPARDRHIRLRFARPLEPGLRARERRSWRRCCRRYHRPDHKRSPWRGGHRRRRRRVRPQRADNPGVFEPAQRQRHRQRRRGSRQTGLDAGTHRRYGAITGGESPGTTGESPRPTWSRGDGTSRGGSTPATEYPRTCGRSQGPAAAPAAAAATAAPTTVSPGAVRAVDGLLPALHIAPVLAGSTPRSAA